MAWPTRTIIGHALGNSSKKIYARLIVFILSAISWVLGMYLHDPGFSLEFLPNFWFFCLSGFPLAPLAYAVYLKLQVHFDLSYANSIKLIDWMLLDIRPVLKLILGTALLMSLATICQPFFSSWSVCMAFLSMIFLTLFISKHPRKIGILTRKIC